MLMNRFLFAFRSSSANHIDALFENSHGSTLFSGFSTYADCKYGKIWTIYQEFLHERFLGCPEPWGAIMVLCHQGGNCCNLIYTIKEGSSSLNVVMDALLTTKHLKYKQMQQRNTRHQKGY